MKSINELQSDLVNSNQKLAWLYCCDENQTEIYARRYLHVLNQLEETYGAHSGAALFSAPGRTEIGGNHTDHQQGCVLAGAVNIDMIAAVGENNLNQLRLTSEGYAGLWCEPDLRRGWHRQFQRQRKAGNFRTVCGSRNRAGKHSGADHGRPKAKSP